MTENSTALVLEQVRARPAASAIAYTERGEARAISWRELDERVRDLLVGWDRLGLHKPDRIGLLARNRWEWIVLDLAAAGRGLVTVSLDPLWSERHLARILAHARIRCVCVEHLDVAIMLMRLRGELPELRHVVLIDTPADQHVPAEVTRLSELLAFGRAARRERPGIDDAYLACVRADDVATIIHTGGSTGQPKGVLRTHGNAVSRGWAQFPWMGEAGSEQPDDCLLVPLSFAHSAGRWWYQTALARGATVALPSEGVSLHELQLLSPTHLATVPRVVVQLQSALQLQVGQLWRELELLESTHPSYPRLQAEFTSAVRAQLGGRVRHIVWGGAPLAASTSAFFERAGIVIAGGYGGTEPGIVAVRPRYAPAGSVGPAVGAEARIVDGEIWLRGPGVTIGYLDNAAADAQGWAEDGWWRTGDAGRIDADGNLIVIGRVRAMFNCSEGTNIDPVELEQLLEAQTGIAEAILIGHRRPYLAALLAVDREQLAASGVNDVSAHLEQTLARLNVQLEEFERIRRFHVIDGRFAPELRQLTSANKVRIDRDAVAEVYRDAIASLYPE